MARERCPGSGTPVRNVKFSLYSILCPECNVSHAVVHSANAGSVCMSEHFRTLPQLSPNQAVVLASLLRVPLTEYLASGSWLSEEHANDATDQVVRILREAGVKL